MSRLNDNDIMTFGRYKDEPLGDIPDDYWRWFLSQDFCDYYPELVEYANLCVDDDDV